MKMTVQQQLQKSQWVSILQLVQKLSNQNMQIYDSNSVVKQLQVYVKALNKQKDQFSNKLCQILKNLVNFLANSPKNDQNFNEILQQAKNLLRKKIENLSSNKYKISQIFTNENFNTQSFLRNLILQQYHAKEFKIERLSGKIQGMLILNNQLYTLEKASQVLENINKKFYVFTNEPKHTLENLVILSGPNAGILENYAMPSSLFKNFLEQKFNIVIWNYYGYNQEDNNSCSLDSITKNLQDLIQILKSSCEIKKLILYGKSLGGFPSIQNNQLSDAMIVDRSFWDLTVIAQLKFGPVFGLLDIIMKNFFHFSNFLQSKGPVCFVYDPEDEIIPLEASCMYGFLYITSQIYFEQFLNCQMSSNYNKSSLAFCVNSFKRSLYLYEYQKHKLFMQQYFESKLKCNIKDLIHPVKIVTDQIDIFYDLEVTQLQNYSDLEITKFCYLKQQLKNFNSKFDFKNLKNPKNKIQAETEALIIKVIYSFEIIKVFELSLFDVLINDYLNTNLLVFFYWGFILQNNLVFDEDQKDKLQDSIIKIQKEICSIYFIENDEQAGDPILNCILQKFIVILDQLKLLSQIYLEDNKDQTLTKNDVIQMNFFNLRNITKKVKFVKILDGHNTYLRKKQLEKVLEKLELNQQKFMKKFIKKINQLSIPFPYVSGNNKDTGKLTMAPKATPTIGFKLK